MDGKTTVRIIETILSQRGISKSEFYKECGVSSATFSQWRNGVYNPTQEKIAQIENFLGISFSDYERNDPREELRDDYKMLLKSVDGLPQSSVYAIVAEIHKRREAGYFDPTD